MLSWWLTSCIHDPGTWVPRQTGDTASTVDTADPQLQASPSGWGTCGTLRSALTFSSPGFDSLDAISLAPGGASDLIGRFDGPVTLEAGGPGETTLAPLGEWAYLLVRYEQDGGLAWFRQMDGSSQAALRAVAAGPEGGVFVAGSGDALSSFDGGPALGGLGEADAFLARFGPGGELLWTRSFGSTGDDGISALAALPDGGVLAGGYLRGETVLGLGEPGETTVTLPEGAQSVALLARYASDGALVWVISLGGAEETSLSHLAYDAGEGAILVAGYLSGPGATVFGAGTPEERTLVPGEREAYLARYDEDGRFRWVASISGELVYADGIDFLPGGAAVLGGTSDGVATFSLGASEAQTLGENDRWTGWLARYEPDGRLRALTAMVSPKVARVYDVAALPGGDTILLASFNEEVVLGLEESPIRLVSASARDGLLATFDPEGKLRCALQFQAVDGETLSYVTPAALLVRDNGGIEVVGELNGSAVLGAGTDAEVALTSVEDDGLRLIVDLLDPP